MLCIFQRRADRDNAYQKGTNIFGNKVHVLADML